MALVVRVPAADGANWFKPSDLDALIGQEPVLTVNFDQCRPVGRCTVRGARLDETSGDLYLDIELYSEAAREVLGPGAPPTVTIGGVLPGPEEVAQGKHVQLREIVPAASVQPRNQAGPYSIGSNHWPGVSKVIEEMGELQKVLGKLIATGGVAEHWEGSDLHEKLNEEVADVRAALDFFEEANQLPVVAIGERASAKRATFWRWHREQRG